MTLKQLAKLANVSHSTASKALRYSKELNDETIELVNRVARENGYFLQQKKQRLAAMKHRPLKFAIICPEIVSVHYASIATELNDILWEQNAIAQIHVCNFDDETEREIMLRCLEAADINGVISLSQRHSQFDLRFPTVRMSNAPTDSVGFDYTGGMRKALLYLKEAGHRKIGFIGEKLTTPKRDTFLALTDELGLSADPGCIIDSDRRFEAAGFHAVAGLLASGRETTVSYRMSTPACTSRSASASEKTGAEKRVTYRTFVAVSGSPSFHSGGSVSYPYRTDRRRNSSARPVTICFPRPLHIGTKKLTSPLVASPPRLTDFSISSVRTPCRAADTAAAAPATPPPATITSYAAFCGIFSVIST